MITPIQKIMNPGLGARRSAQFQQKSLVRDVEAEDRPEQGLDSIAFSHRSPEQSRLSLNPAVQGGVRQSGTGLSAQKGRSPGRSLESRSQPGAYVIPA